MTKRESEIDVPEKLGVHGFELIRMIGAGAAGEVWVGENEMTKSLLAVKIIRQKTRHQKSWLKRELNGLIAYEKIAPKPDTLIDIREVKKTGDGLGLYYTMPLADGVREVGPKSKRYKALTLGYRLKKEGMLGIRESAGITLRIAEALQTIHSFTLIHRDVKPDNIIFIRGKAVLADIGLVTDDRDSVSFSGTPLYFETGNRPSARGDLYALGKVLYQMINGKSPKDFPDAGSRTDNTDLHLFAPLNDICMRACGDEEDGRYKAAAEMLSDLRVVISMPARLTPSPIDIKYADLGGRNGFLGEPVHEELTCPDGVGRHRTFRNPSGMLSSIHWHPDTGAFETHGGIRSEWEKRDWEKSYLGYPVSNEDDFTDADYLRDILEKSAKSLPPMPRLIGRRNLFQGGCLVWLSDPDIRSKCGEFAAFCRPLAGGNGWRLVVKDKPSKSFWDSIMEYLPGKSDSARPLTILEDQLEPGYAAKAWAAYQKAAAEKTQSKTEPAKEAAPAEEPTESEECPQDPADTASPAQPPAFDSDDPSDHLLAGTDPIWGLQKGPNEFSWEGRCGRLYKMTAPYTFIKGQSRLNENDLAKIQVAVFLPPNYRPDTPVVFTLADTDNDFRANSWMVQTALDCGYGMVAIDTPFTGICKFGADLDNGIRTENASDFITTVDSACHKCGTERFDDQFFYHTQRFTARNLHLIKIFLESEFNLKPGKTILTGAGFGVFTAGFAFNATGFGDILLGFAGVPEIRDGNANIHTIHSGYNSFPDAVGDFISKTLPAAIDPLSLFSEKTRQTEGLWRKRLNPATYAEKVKRPREVHLLCGIKDSLFSKAKIEDAIGRYTGLQGTAKRGALFNETSRGFWPSQLSRSLSHGKSVVWFDGGHDLSGWRGDLRLKFLEIKLRMLNGGT